MLDGPKEDRLFFEGEEKNTEMEMEKAEIMRLLLKVNERLELEGSDREQKHREERGDKFLPKY